MTAGDDGTNLTSTGVAGGRRLYPSVLLPVPQRYPSVLQAELASRYTLQSPTVANAGLSGEAVLGTSTFSRFSAVVTTGLYDSVLIMEGANDLADRDATIEPAVIGALAQMIELAKARNIRPILATIPPENQAGSRGLAWSLVAPFDDRIRLLAVAEGIPLADVYQAFNGDLSLIGPDGLHPTAAGYKVIADTFFKAIEQNLETSSTTLRLPARAIVRRR
jgi:lysophospholipase L1-like esterase